MAQRMPPRRPHRRRRMIFKLLLLLALAIVLTCGLGVYLLRSQPAAVARQRQALQRATPEQLHALAQSAQNKIAGLTTLQLDEQTQALIDAGQATPAQIREAMLQSAERDRTLHLTLDELNAWLRTELPQHLGEAEAAALREIHDYGLTIEDGHVVLFFDADWAGMRQTFSLTCDFTFSEEGPARLRVTQLRSGRLPIPLNVLAAQAEADQAGRLDALAQALDGVEVDPVLHWLRDRVRQPRIIGATVHEQAIELQVRSERIDR